MTKKELLLDCAMRAVARDGLMSVSMQTITQMASTAEGLIYKHYQTKENLLLQCYLLVYKEIKEHLETMQISNIQTKEEMIDFLHDIWLKYIDFFLSNDYKTLFFYEYRNSFYMKAAAADGNLDPKTYFDKLVNVFYSLDSDFNIFNKVDIKLFFIYVTDVTLVFAVRAINFGISCDEAMYENLWNLLWHGEDWLINSYPNS